MKHKTDDSSKDSLMNAFLNQLFPSQIQAFLKVKRILYTSGSQPLLRGKHKYSLNIHKVLKMTLSIAFKTTIFLILSGTKRHMIGYIS